MIWLKKMVSLVICCALVLSMNPKGFAKQSTRADLEATLKEKQGKLQETKKQITAFEQELSSYDDNIALNMKRLEESQRKVEEQRRYFKKLMVRIYKNHDADLLAQLVTSGSFARFLSRLQIIAIILKEERSALTKYNDAKTSVEEALKEIQDAKIKQRPIIEKATKKVSSIEKELKTLMTQLEEFKVKDGTIKYYDGSYGTGRFCNPCPGGRLVNNFWERRGGYCHKGIDIRRPIGSAICAADSGVVTKMKSNPGGYGYYVVISHGGGIATLYAHMYRSTVNVSLGQRVQKGQAIARVGMNGDTTGPHLHFEVHQNGRAISPMPFLT